jgi:hypothetical protein
MVYREPAAAKLLRSSVLGMLGWSLLDLDDHH